MMPQPRYSGARADAVIALHRGTRSGRFEDFRGATDRATAAHVMSQPRRAPDADALI